MPYRPAPHRPKVLDAPRCRPERDSASRRGYGRRWRRLRLVVLRERVWCADPFGHHAADGRPAFAEQVDHIVPRAAGGSDDASNLQCLCTTCHARKTVLCDGGFGRQRRTLSKRRGSTTEGACGSMVIDVETIDSSGVAR